MLPAIAGLPLEQIESDLLARVAFVAQVSPTDGALAEVDDVRILSKLLFAARDESLPRIHTVVVAESQILTGLNFIPAPGDPQVLMDPAGDFRIIQAGTVLEALQRIIPDRLPGAVPNYVERPDLDEAYERVLQQETGRWILAAFGISGTFSIPQHENARSDTRWAEDCYSPRLFY